MIYLYSGTPGSGKSLHMARDIYYDMKFKRPIVTNIELNYPKGTYYYLPNWELTPEKLKRFSREVFQGKKIKEDCIRLYIDEAQLIFNCRDFMSKGRNEWLEFFTQHRKLGYQVTLVSQFQGMLDKQIRTLIEYEFIHRKLSNYGLKGWLLSLLMLSPSSMFCAVKVWSPMKQRVSSEFFAYKKKYAKIYDTFSLFGIAESGDSVAEEATTSGTLDVSHETSVLSEGNTTRHAPGIQK